MKLVFDNQNSSRKLEATSFSTGANRGNGETMKNLLLRYLCLLLLANLAEVSILS